MTNELPQMRASDAERERVAEALREAVAEGRLQLDEFQERLDSAYQARTRAELEPLLRDLPQAGGAADELLPESRRTGWSDRFGGAPTSRRAFGILGGFGRRGRWTAPARFTSITVWGGGQIDLREARFAERQVEIRCIAIMGGVHVVVPVGAEVEVRGVGIMGGFDHTAVGTGEPGAPRIVISGFAVWGGVGTERKRTREERRRVREERELAREERRRELTSRERKELARDEDEDEGPERDV